MSVGLHLSFKNIFSIALIFLIFPLIITDHRSKIKIPFYIKAYIVFYLYTVASDLFIIDKPLSFQFFYRNGHIPVILMMIIIENISIKKYDFTRLLTIIKVLLIVGVVVIIIQQLGVEILVPEVYKQDASVDQGQTVIRLYSIYGYVGQLDVGFSYLSFMAIIICEALIHKKASVWFWFLVTIVYSFLSKARWIMFNGAILIFMIFNVTKIKATNTIKTGMILLVIVFVSFFTMDYLGLSPLGIINDRILQTDSKENSAVTRIIAVELFAKLFPKAPTLGAGQEINSELESELAGRSSQIHVGYLSLLYYYGIIGGAIYLMFLFMLMRKLYFNARKTSMWGAFYAVSGFLLANLTLVWFNLFFPGMLFALAYDKYYMDQYEEKRYAQIQQNVLENA